MDGMLFLAFFFPVILSMSIVLNWVALLFSLWGGFGAQMGEMFAVSAAKAYLPSWVTSSLVSVLRNPPLRRYGTFLYPLVVNVVNIVTVFGSYSLGKVLYSKNGWKFAQPLRGGLRFVILQTTWSCVLAVALMLPWLSNKHFGWLKYLGVVDEEDEDSFGGLLVSGAAMGMLSQSLVIVALMAFENSSTRKDLRSLEVGSWNWKKMFGEASGTFWWLFLFLQTSLVIFSLGIATLADQMIKNSTIRMLMSMVFVSVLAVALALTNAVGGKWRHGEQRFHMFMPFRGGLFFMLLQAFGWSLFACALLAVSASFFDMSFLPRSSWLHLGNAGILGVASQLAIVLSLLVFEPSKAGESVFLERLDQSEVVTPTGASRRWREGTDRRQKEDDSTATAAAAASATGGVRRRRATRKNVASQHHRSQARATSQTVPVKRSKSEIWVIERIIGKRPKADMEGTFEFLVQWEAPSRGSDWIMKQTLLAKTNRAAAQSAISAFEKRRENIGQLSDDDREEAEAAEEEDEVEEKDNEVISRRRPQTKRGRQRNKSRSKTPSRRRGGSSAAKSLSPDGSLEWEECEDEMGNVFYYCITTGETVNELAV